MQSLLKKLMNHVHHLTIIIFLVNLIMIFPASSILAQKTTRHCGTITIQSPLLNQILLCKSDQLYFTISPQPTNSLILFDCSNTLFFQCIHTESEKGYSSCSIVDDDDVGKLEQSFDPREMNCTQYRMPVFRRGSEKLEIGTRISFDIPDHVPNPCDHCARSDGNCGAGLRCLCHPQQCKDKVISVGAILKPYGNILFCMALFITLQMGLFHEH